MKEYREIQKRRERTGTVIAVIATVLFHTGLIAFGSFSGLTYIYPPPPEQVFLVDFSEEAEKVPVRQHLRGSMPQSETPDRTRPVELAQKSEAMEKGTKNNLAEESTVDDFGDVEKYEPEREKPINKKALFSAAKNKKAKDTLAAQTASKVSDALKAGHAQGNTHTSINSSTPNAVLQGRKTVGVIAKPEYRVQEEGIVVVDIWVDNYGKVTKALPGAQGTTVNNADLWQAARKAALSTHFNTDADAPALQKGKITYIFRLK